MSNTFRWREENKNTFEQYIDLNRLAGIQDELSNAVQQHTGDKGFINHIAVEISNVFQSSVARTFEMNSNRKYQRDSSDKPWYRFKCRNARIKYMRAG